MYKLTAISTLLVLVLNFSAKEKGTNTLTNYNAKLNNTGIVFTENKGQVYDQNYKARPDVLYGSMAGNLALHIKKTGVSYQLYRVDEWKEVEDEFTHEKRKEKEKQTIYRIDISWLNANTNFYHSTDEALSGYNNYYLESCPNGALNVKSFTGVTLHNLYKGIDLHYYEINGQLKHDYIVAPNTDYKQIQLQIDGAGVSINRDGSLLLTTPLGKIQEGAPIVYQNGKQLKANWKLESNILSFEVESYNPTQELIIDPVTRIWGTYYGGSGAEEGYSCASDAAGNVYLTGLAESNTGTIIATSGAHQALYDFGYDGFLVKFNTNGVRQWGTYYGGSERDIGLSCACDALGNVYFAGATGSNMGVIIATAGAHQPSYGGGGDAFLVKFSTSGVRLWGTYYGGGAGEIGNSCTTDATGNVYLAGSTKSNAGTGIATIGAHQTVNAGGVWDAFLVKFNPSGVRQWGTYYGGSGSDEGFECAIDTSGNVYLAGSTTSNTGTVIATIGAHQTVYGGGTGDSFLVKFKENGQREWGTYYGGGVYEAANSCALDAAGNVYLAGLTSSNSGTVIATAGAHQSLFGGGYDAFLVKFNTSGVRLWGTYYGGSGSDQIFSCTTDAIGNVNVAGWTNSFTGTVLATAGAIQTTHSGGGYDAFLAVFNTSGVRLGGTYYGGIWDDYGFSCTSDGAGNVYLAGPTSSNIGTVIATAGAHQTVNGGNFDGFLAKFMSYTPTTLTENLLGDNTSLIIYPNPSKGLFNLQSTVASEITVIDVLGKVITNTKLEAGAHQLNLSELANGIYFLKAECNSQLRTFKLIKE